MMMTSGYFSSDRKLKMHQTLKASSWVMSRCLVQMFFLKHRVQHILLNSSTSKSSRTWEPKPNCSIQSESHRPPAVCVFTNAKQELLFVSFQKPQSAGCELQTWFNETLHFYSSQSQREESKKTAPENKEGKTVSSWHDSVLKYMCLYYTVCNR